MTQSLIRHNHCTLIHRHNSLCTEARLWYHTLCCLSWEWSSIACCNDLSFSCWALKSCVWASLSCCSRPQTYNMTKHIHKPHKKDAHTGHLLVLLLHIQAAQFREANLYLPDLITSSFQHHLYLIFKAGKGWLQFSGLILVQWGRSHGEFSGYTSWVNTSHIVWQVYSNTETSRELSLQTIWWIIKRRHFLTATYLSNSTLAHKLKLLSFDELSISVNIAISWPRVEMRCSSLSWHILHRVYLQG